MPEPHASITTPDQPAGFRAGLLHGVGSHVAFAAATVIVLAFAGMLWLLQSSQTAIDARDRDTQMTLISGAISSAFDQAGRFAVALAETVARRDAISTALAAGDRDALQRLSQGTYDYLKSQAGIQIFGFHTPDIRYLLRMHKVESFGDDISGLRAMVVAANKTKRAQTGLEIGLGGIGVRGIAVVNRGDAFAGTVEVGVDVKPILDLVKTSTNADIAVVIVPSMSGVALDDKMPRFGDLSLAMSTDDDLFSSLLKNSRIRPTRAVQIGEQQIDNRAYSMVTQPLVDFSGRLVGMTVAVTEDARAASRRVRVELWVIAVCGGILAYGVFAVLFNTASRRRQRRSA
jgi:hypothetical protein